MFRIVCNFHLYYIFAQENFYSFLFLIFVEISDRNLQTKIQTHQTCTQNWIRQHTSLFSCYIKLNNNDMEKTSKGIYKTNLGIVVSSLDEPWFLPIISCNTLHEEFNASQLIPFPVFKTIFSKTLIWIWLSISNPFTNTVHCLHWEYKW